MRRMINKYYHKKTNQLNRSYDLFTLGGDTNPWKLLAAAIIFQAAVDCEQWKPELEDPKPCASNFNGIQYRRRAKLIQFINSDWIDMLLSWQNEIKPETVCEELVRRLQHETL